MKDWVGRVKLGGAVFAAALLLLCSALPHSVNAAVNSQINFQGKLTNPDGTNVANGSYSIRFRIYTSLAADATNACVANSCSWEETKTLTVTDGIFQTALGDTTSLPGNVDFNNPSLYLGIKVGSDAEMSPRIRFTASPYSLNSERLNGLASSAFGQIDTNNVWSGSNTIQGSSATQLVIQNSSAQTLLVANTSTQRIAIGPAAVPANGVLTVGTNTTTASGGLFFGTDTNLYRSAANTLTTDDKLTAQTIQSTGGNFVTSDVVSGTTSSIGAFLYSGNITGTANTSSGGVTVKSGNNTATGNSGIVTIQSGDVTSGSSGNVVIDVGASPTGAGALMIGTTNTTAINAGRTGVNTYWTGTVFYIGDFYATQNATIGSTLSVTGGSTLTGALAVNNTTNINTGSTTALQVRSGATSTLTVDTANGRISVGSGAPASGVLTVGTNTTVASGGLYLGTDTNLYRSAANTITTDSSMNVLGSLNVGTGTGTGSLASWNSGNAFWINMPTTGPSGIGSGGPGANAWIGYASGAGNWFTNAAAGDIAYRNTGGRLLFGATAGLYNMAVSSDRVEIGSPTTDATAMLLVLDSYNQAADPAGVNGSTYYNSSLGKFRCYEGGAWKNCITKELATRSFVDTTVDAVADNNTTSYWDSAAENGSTFPNITLSSASKSVWAIVTIETNGTSTAEVEVTARVERSTSAGVAACNSGTAIGAQPGTFSTNTNSRKASTVQFIDNPNTTNKVWYNVCADVDTVGTNSQITRIRVTLFEIDNANN